MVLKIFLYEFITGGGMFSVNPSETPAGSLLREGAAMITALAADFSGLSETEVVAFHDCRLTEFKLPDFGNVVGQIKVARQVCPLPGTPPLRFPVCDAGQSPDGEL